MKSEQANSEKADVGLLLFVLSVAAPILFTNVNTLIYNWVYLRNVYDKPYDPWAFARMDMFTGYWGWTPGKLLCIVNGLLLVLPFVLLLVLKSKKRAD